MITRRICSGVIGIDDLLVRRSSLLHFSLLALDIISNGTRECCMAKLLIILIVPVCLITGLILIALWIRQIRKDAIAAIRRSTEGEEVYLVEDCNFFGQQSAGYKQVRGNGILALTDKGIHFRMLIPSKELFVPLDSIKGISQPRSFLGKTKMRDLLRVDFVNAEGRDDAGAWLVPSLQWWSEAVEELRTGKEPTPPSWKHRT